MEDSIVASYTALLLGCLCQGSQVRAVHTHSHTVLVLSHSSVADIILHAPHPLPLTLRSM